MDIPASDPKPAFHKTFTSEIKSLEDSISNLPSLRGSSQQDTISKLLAKITTLNHDLKEASIYLPGYDQKIYSEQLKSVTEQLSTTRKELAPRAKFSFKNRRTGAASDPAPAAASNSSVSQADTGASSTSSAPTISPATETPPTHFQTSSLTNLTNVHASPPPPTSTTSILSLSHLTNCIIHSPSKTFTTVSITSIHSSILICTSTGPAHLTSLKNTVLVISCQQFRLHDSEDVDIYLKCGSRPIIERCKGLRFTYLPGLFGGNTEGEDGWWRKVDDFNWLKEGKASPNWKVMEEGERVEEEVWEKVIEEGSTLEDGEIVKVLPRGEI